MFTKRQGRQEINAREGVEIIQCSFSNETRDFDFQSNF